MTTAASDGHDGPGVPVETDQPEIDTAAADADADDATGTDQPWLRLHPRTALAGIVLVAGALAGTAVVTALAMLIGGVGAAWVAFWVIGGWIVLTAIIAAIEIIRVRATRYRIRNARLDLRFQFVASSTRSLPLRRIRTVDITADLVQRRLGLAALRFGTGDQTGTKFSLNSVDEQTAEDIRRTILGAPTTGTDSPGTGRLATFNPSWIRYAPVSMATPALGLAAIGGVFQVADWFNAVPTMLNYVRDQLSAIPLPVQLLMVLIAAWVIGVLGSMVIFIESWWGYRLDRGADGTVAVQRGLLVQRSSTFQGARIRGITLDESIGYRRMTAAKVKIVAVGLPSEQSQQESKTESSTIVPAVPRALALEVATAILGGAVPEQLQSHPPAAARRRYRWSAMLMAAVLVLLVVGSLLLTGQLWWLVGVAALLGCPAAWWVAHDSARALGHLITDDHVVLRSGSIIRNTHVLDRAGILGWNLRQSPAQRRVGLVTVVATSAASPGNFRHPDVDPADAAALQRTNDTTWDQLWATAASPSPG